MKNKSILVTASLANFMLLVYSTVIQSHDELGVRPHHIDLPASPTAVMRAFSEGKLGDELTVQNLMALTTSTCTIGFAGDYPCNNVDLMSFMPLSDLVDGQAQSNDEANDIWGWTDQVTGSEYAIIGRVFGTSFVDVTDASNPVLIGELDTHGRFGSSWRDIKVYKNHAFIVSEARRHGMQVFDLTQLRNVANPPVLFQETEHYNGFGSAHNIVINEDSGYAYGVGTDKCSGGLEMVDISVPLNPTDAGCFDGDGYTHDAQCVNYTGEDEDYIEKEICIASNEDSLTIVDVTDKANPIEISSTMYSGVGYTHQGWLTENQKYFLLDDELDEQNFGHNTLTRVFDLSDLDFPSFVGIYDSGNPAIDHNQYVKGNYSYQSNYRSGLRVLDISGVATAELEEVAFFDIYPDDNAAQFNGAWSNYPYFDSGIVVVSGIEQGLFVLKPNMGPPVDSPPEIYLVTPGEGETVNGAMVAVTANANDDNFVTQVEFFVDGVSIGVDTGVPYGVNWESTNVQDGIYLVSAVATDSIGQTGSDSNNVIVDNLPDPTTTMHVGDLDGASVAGGRGGKWNATVTITVHENSEMLISGATINGTWSAGTTGVGSCVTNGVGVCNITKANIKRNSSSVTFSVTSVTQASYIYDGANHDSDGNSNGSIIIVAKP